MDKILYILILILYDNNFYKNINIISNTTGYEYLVNKNNKLESNYIPNDLEEVNNNYSLKDKYLRKEAKIYFEKMARVAKEDGYNIILVSGYRSYNYQDKLFNKYVKEKGYNYASLCSAKAGHSEHQTGLAIDVANESLDYDNFDKTKEFIWMINNSYKYGYILRYPKSMYHITGFKYEPWHFRYVGIELSTYLFKKNLTLEEYYINKKS